MTGDDLYTSTDLATKIFECNLIGKSPLILEVEELIKTAAVSSQRDSSLNVLITGETGTGKELVAGSIHYLSERKDKPYVKINCAGFSEELLQSELFGHKKGSFTGAYTDKKGLIEVAHEGTVLLDEIGDMPFSLQAKLLRFLQEHKIYPVGSTETKDVDVRIISSTNKDLEKYMREGKFRDDLYYRLNTFEIYVPPLRERPKDIPLLVEHFIKKHNTYGLNIEGIDKKVEDLFTKYQWPGNIRELENYIRRALVIMKVKNQSGTLSEEYFPKLFQASHQTVAFSSGTNPKTPLTDRVKEIVSPEKEAKIYSITPLKDSVGKVVSDAEREVIRWALNETNGKKKKAARILNISYKTMLNKIKFLCLPELQSAEIPVSPLTSYSTTSLKEIGKQVGGNAEKESIRKTLIETNWNRGITAKILDISPKALYYKMDKYGFGSKQGSITL